MSQSLIIDVLLHGLAVAISPEAIFSAILILLTDKARSNGLAYLAGWIAGLAIVAASVLVFDDIVAGSPGQLSKSTLTGILRIGLGLLLLGLAARRWIRHRRRKGVAPSPRWPSPRTRRATTSPG